MRQTLGIKYDPERPLPTEVYDEIEKRFAKLIRDDPIVRAWYDGGRSGGLLKLAVVLGEDRKVLRAQLAGAMAMRCPNPEGHGR